jgi:hypothetical protein
LLKVKDERLVCAAKPMGTKLIAGTPKSGLLLSALAHPLFTTI